MITAYSPSLRYIAAGSLVLLGLSAVGCSDMTATVTGRLYLDEEPLKIGEAQRGMIVFRPVAGGATCTGAVGADGSYGIATGRSSALVPGDYLVSVRVVELIKSETEGAAPSGKPLTPAVYADPLTSGLTCLVRSGPNNYDIRLDSSAGPTVLPPPAVAVTEADGDQMDAESGDEVKDDGGPVGEKVESAAKSDDSAVVEAPDAEEAGDE